VSLGTNASATQTGEMRTSRRRRALSIWGVAQRLDADGPALYGAKGKRPGLYDYDARYYDPELGRFIKADMIVSNRGNPQAFNRYAYVLGNPMALHGPDRTLVMWGSV